MALGQYLEVARQPQALNESFVRRQPNNAFRRKSINGKTSHGRKKEKEFSKANPNQIHAAWWYNIYLLNLNKINETGCYQIGNVQSRSGNLQSIQPALDTP